MVKINVLSQVLRSVVLLIADVARVFILKLKLNILVTLWSALFLVARELPLHIELSLTSLALKWFVTIKPLSVIVELFYSLCKVRARVIFI